MRPMIRIAITSPRPGAEDGEHDAESTEPAPRPSVRPRRLPPAVRRLGAGREAPCEHAAWPSAIRRSSTPRSASRTVALGARAGEHARRLRPGAPLGATGLETDLWLTADGSRSSTTTAWCAAGPPASDRRRAEVGAPGLDPDAERVLPSAVRASTCPSTSATRRPGRSPSAQCRPSTRAAPPALALPPDVPSLVALRPLDPQVKLVNSNRLERMREGPSGGPPPQGRADRRRQPPFTDFDRRPRRAFHRFELATASPAICSTSTCSRRRWPPASTASSATGSTA